MRVPEFRAYDKDKKIMIHDFDQSVVKHYDMKWGESIHLKVYTIGLAYGTLSEWTGEYDIKNTKVFEDDVLADEDGVLYVVSLKDSKFVATELGSKDWYFLDDMDFKVVDNTHQDENFNMY